MDGLPWTAAVLAGITALLAAGAQPQAEPENGPEGESYGVGYIVGREVRGGLLRDGVAVDMDLLTRGFRDGLGGAEPEKPRREMQRLLASVHEEMERRMVQRLLEESPGFKRLHDDNLARSRKFHALFGRQEGVVTTDDGLQYKVLRPGTGPSPRRADRVVIRGSARLLDGTVVYPEKTETVRVGAVVEGAARLLEQMRAGAKWQFAIPPALGFGPGGRPPLIGPNETIVGFLELVAIEEQP